MSTVTSLDVPTEGSRADALLAVPDEPGRYPGIVLHMDAFGLRPRIAQMAGRFADAGYVVLAPNVFHRSARSPIVDHTHLADPARREAVFGQVMPMVTALTPDLAAADGRAWLDFLARHERVAEGPFGTIGYCMGGRLALRTAAAAPDLVAAAASYHAGQVVTAAPDSVHLTFPHLRAEVYLAHADHDASMDAGQQAEVARALAAAGVTYRAELYPGAPHGFTMADTAAYDPAAEQRHWETALALFDRVLG